VPDSLDVDLDLLHLLVVSAEDALPVDRMRAVLDRELTRLSVAVRQHFAAEEAVVRRGGGDDELEAQHRLLRDRLVQACELVRSAPLRQLKADLIEMLDALAEHERRESAAASD
jgi:hypothetical protein